MEQNEAAHHTLGDEPDYVTKTKRGRDKIIYQGYAYVKDKDGAQVTYWRCEKKDELHCKGRVTTAEMKITKVVGEHCHAPEPGRKKLGETRDSIVYPLSHPLLLADCLLQNH